MRKLLILVVLLIGSCCGELRAQSTNASVTGYITDPTKAVIVGAKVIVINVDTNGRYEAATNSAGSYDVSNLPPGRYRIEVEKPGFKTVVKSDLILHVQDTAAINFEMALGSASEIVTVRAGELVMNTTDATVSTVVDRKFVENVPLNGRSFQGLILLTPGVVTTSPQSVSGGEFSVNGQRTESNYYSVDGVSANTNIDPLSAARSPGPGGSLPVSTALGTTQGLVSLDALEEFRVQSSTYSAEYGRNPGGQFSFVTRSGTNQWHGTAFDYLRNDAFDANNWFNDYFGRPEPPLRQNDFGGTLGGPIRIPHVYNGKDKTFFFFSYEGLRLLQPQAATPTFVPDTYLRTCASVPLQQALNAFPQPTTPGSAPNCANADPGNGLAGFVGTWSNPSNIDSTSVRLDHKINDKLSLFFRFSNTSSSQNVRNAFVPSVVNPTDNTTRTYTFGATNAFSSRLSNEFRLNYSSNDAAFSAALNNFGGANTVDLLQLQGFAGGTKPSPNVAVILSIAGHRISLNEFGNSGQQIQWNIVDTLGLSMGRQHFKFGFDFRTLRPQVNQNSPLVQYTYLNAASVRANSVNVGLAFAFAPASPIYTNFSAFAQDEVRLTPRLSLSMGLRWEVNPPPGAPTGNLPYTVQGSSLSTLTLAPQGTPLWSTTWFNFAPRLGVAYVLRNTSGWEAVVRGGGGVFFDSGQQLGSLGYGGPGFSVMKFFGSAFGSPAAFPLPPAQVSPAIVNPPVPRYPTLWAFPSHLQLPYTLEWNGSVEQGLGKSQAITFSYVGANGRRMLELNQINAASFNPMFSTIIVIRNGLTLDYNALQARFQRRFAQGLEGLASYTWAHAIDYGSQNNSLPYVRGNSDYDVRHSFSGAVSYDLPNHFQTRFARAVLNHWGLDDRFTARTAFPVTLQGAQITDPATGQTVFSGLNLVPGQPVYIYGSQCAALYNNGKGCPSGRAINPNAFSLPPGCNSFSCPPGTPPGNAPRNLTRGFGPWQMDFALRREFPIYERLRLQFRAEAFNIFNHPNFGTINATYCSPLAGPGCTFGQVTRTLDNSLVGLSSLYQMGGSRSMQFALKLAF